MPDDILGENTGDAPTPTQDVQEAAPSPAEAIDVNAAGSSAAEATVASPLSVIEGALAPEEAPPSKDEPEANASVDDEEDAETDLSEDPSEDELKAAAPKTRERMEKLLSQRHEAREQAKELAPKAEQWDRIEAFRKEQNLTPEHLANAIQITALIENDPARALEALGPVWQSLQQRAGAVLPDDLEAAVRSGEITRERALQVAKANATLTNAQTSQQRQEEARQQQAEAEKQAKATEMRSQAATTWETAKAASDPDWHLKRDQVADQFYARMMRDGAPETAEATTKMLEDAAAAVDKLIGNFRQKAPARPAPSAGVSPRSAGAPAPKSYLDVVEQALG